MFPRLFTRLARLNPTVVFLATITMVLTALIMGGWVGALIIFAISAGLTTILIHQWPILDIKGRMVRITLLTALVAVAGERLVN